MILALPGQANIISLPLALLADASAIVPPSAPTIYLKAITGTNAGKWWTSGAWSAVEGAAGSATYEGGAVWSLSIASAAWTDGASYVVYAANASDIVPIERDVVCSSAMAGLGSGARTVTLTVNDGATAIQAATVRMTMSGKTQVGQTSVSGTVTFNLADGTWTVAITAAGYSFAGASLAVSGDTTHTYSMTATTIPAATDPDQTTAWIYMRHADGSVASGHKLQYRMTAGPGDDGYSYSGVWTDTAESDATGLIQQAIARGATYQFRRGNGHHETVTGELTGNTELPEILGGL